MDLFWRNGMADWMPYIGGMLAVAVGYGELKSRVRDAHKRLDAHDEQREMRNTVVDEKLEGIRKDIADFRVSVERRLPRE